MNLQMTETPSLVHWYQPIKQLHNGRTIGYEALVRNSLRCEVSPLDIFAEAERQGCRNTLDCQLIYKAVATINNTNSYQLFLNVFPSTLLEKSFLDWWDTHMAADFPLILEISEMEPINDWKALRDIICKLRDRGAKIALDDMGMGYSFFQHWIELSPEYIKLDRYYAEDLAESHIKQQVLRSLVEMFKGSTEIILEGIETESDLKAAKILGVSYVQGYFLGRPSPWREDYCFKEQ